MIKKNNHHNVYLNNYYSVYKYETLDFNIIETLDGYSIFDI